ncbi:MAG: hypothetical protein ACOVOG_12315, partial [Rubrivivax sp.]
MPNPPQRFTVGIVQAACLLTLTSAALAQDAGSGAPEGNQREATSAQRVEIVARQSATDLRRAASVAKQI